jgi:CheY-like chemotaxis protein
MNKKIILVVEDEKIIRESLVEKLNKEGFIVFEAKDGVEGFDISVEKHPNIILLDLAVPKMDGLKMMEKLLKNDLIRNINFVILTNLEKNEKIAEAIEIAGKYKCKTFEYYIKSNIKLDDLVKKIKTKL